MFLSSPWWNTLWMGHESTCELKRKYSSTQVFLNRAKKQNWMVAPVSHIITILMPNVDLCLYDYLLCCLDKHKQIKSTAPAIAYDIYTTCMIQLVFLRKQRSLCPMEFECFFYNVQMKGNKAHTCLNGRAFAINFPLYSYNLHFWGVGNKNWLFWRSVNWGK